MEENLVVPPRTRYAKSGDLNIAYQVFGEGPMDLVYIPGAVSHIEFCWENPRCERFLTRLASFARVITFDKRGMGLSDPIPGAATVEERMDDVRAVMDAAGSERAAIFGVSEGCALGALFAGTYPDRATAAVLYGSFATLRPHEDYPWGWTPEEWEEMMAGIPEAWGEGVSLLIVAADHINDEQIRPWWERFERMSTSPGAALAGMRLNYEIDIRDILPAIRVPTLLLHRTDDFLPVEGARYMAKRIPDARLVELPGQDHWPWIEDPDEVPDLVEEFLTGAPAVRVPDRVLATVMFTDIVASTERATELGDQRWRELLELHEAVTRRELDRHRGREVKNTGDGFLATFDGPARGIRCAQAVGHAVRDLGIELRAGLHTGECELRNGDVGGIAVHIGARVSAQAGPGEVLVSQTVKDLVAGSGIEFEDRGMHELKGVPGDWRLFAAQR